MSRDFWPSVKQLWPPEGDNRVTNMDVVFFSDLEDVRTPPKLLKPGETWVQRGHPEVCWPHQWLPEDLGSNVRIFEIRPLYFLPLTRVLDHSVEEAALQQLDRVAEECLPELRWISIRDTDRQGSSLVFVGHGYGGLVLKQTLVTLHDQLGFDRLGFYKDLRSNLCGIVFYGGTNTKFRGLKDWLLDDHLLELSKRFEAALDLKKVKVCVVNKNKSFLQEVKDYSDFERQFIDVMDSNDTCTPTSKEDPSYYTLLEFLEQFLPKGLHQTIDVKKGQEIRLRLSETKDKEALGDMETAITSTRKNKDKEMDERQCVVQHVAGNVDQDCDMLTKEAHKLQTFLRPEIEMAQRDASSTTFPNLHELHSKFLMDTSIFVGVREKVQVDSIEFLFFDAQCMSKVVGVGLHQALVTVTNDNDVKVEALSKSAWESSLASMFMVQDLGAFELIGFKMPKMGEDNIKSMSSPLPSEDIAKQFGVGLKDFHGNHFVTINKKEQNNIFFPVIWEVAKAYKAFKQGDPHVTKRPTGVESSTGAAGASSSGSSQQGKEEGKSVGSWSLSKPSTWSEYGKGDEKDDESKPPGGDPPPNSGPSGEPKMVPRKFTVQVYPEAGQSFHDAEIPCQIRTASMKPELEIVFFRNQIGARFLDVTTRTQCNLGCDVDTDNFGWFQDDITISFRGLSEECKGTNLRDYFASAQKGEKGEITKEITTITSGQARNIANLEARRTAGQGMIAGSGITLEGREETTDSVGANSSRADVEEISGVRQIGGFKVHERNFQEHLIYKFCIPTSIKTSKDTLRFLRYCDTFRPTIVGSWDVSKDNACELAPYTFGVERYLFEIEQVKATFGRKYRQDYVLSMFINLAMTHLNGLRSDETIQIWQRHFVGPAIHVFPSC